MSLSQNERINEKIYKLKRKEWNVGDRGGRKKKREFKERFRIQSKERREIFPDTKLHVSS